MYPEFRSAEIKARQKMKNESAVRNTDCCEYRVKGQKMSRTDTVS